MEYTHTFELDFTAVPEHPHTWSGEVTFDHGGDVHTKFEGDAEFCEAEQQVIHDIFSAIKRLTALCGEPIKIEITAKPIV